MINSRFKGKNLEIIMGERNPRELFITQYGTEYLDIGERVWRVRGLEIADGNLADHSNFDIIFYEEGYFTSVSNRAWYDEVEALADAIISDKDNMWKINRFNYGKRRKDL